MRIEYLADHTELVPHIAKWFWREWRFLYVGKTLADVEGSVRERTNKDRIPCALVAFENDELVGTISLKVSDMETRKDLSPWLAGMFVQPSWRNKGIGSRLVSAIEEKARDLGVARLYLYTPKSENFYSRICWSLKERTVYCGAEVTIMERSLPKRPR